MISPPDHDITRGLTMESLDCPSLSLALPKFLPVKRYFLTSYCR